MGDPGPLGHLALEGVDIGSRSVQSSWIRTPRGASAAPRVPPQEGKGRLASRWGLRGIAQSTDKAGGAEHGHRDRQIDCHGDGHRDMA